MPGVRPEFGRPLPALLRERFGVSPRKALAVAAAALAVLVLAAVAVGRVAGDEALFLRSQAPAFTLLYAEGDLRVARPGRGELVRLTGRRGRAAATMTVRPIRLPPYEGLPILGQAPVAAARRIDELRAAHPDFDLRADGRARVNDAPGYEIAYRLGPPGRQTTWREVVLVEEPESADGVVVRLATRAPGPRRITEREQEFVLAARSAYRSFRFGTERP